VLLGFNSSVFFLGAFVKTLYLFRKGWYKFNICVKTGTVIFQLSNREISSITHILMAGVHGNMLLIQCLNYLLENTPAVTEHLHSGSAITGKCNCT